MIPLIDEVYNIIDQETCKSQDQHTIMNRLKDVGFYKQMFELYFRIFTKEHEFTMTELIKIGKEEPQNFDFQNTYKNIWIYFNNGVSCAVKALKDQQSQSVGQQQQQLQSNQLDGDQKNAAIMECQHPNYSYLQQMHSKSAMSSGQGEARLQYSTNFKQPRDRKLIQKTIAFLTNNSFILQEPPVQNQDVTTNGVLNSYLEFQGSLRKSNKQSPEKTAQFNSNKPLLTEDTHLKEFTELAPDLINQFCQNKLSLIQRSIYLSSQSANNSVEKPAAIKTQTNETETNSQIPQQNSQKNNSEIESVSKAKCPHAQTGLGIDSEFNYTKGYKFPQSKRDMHPMSYYSPGPGHYQIDNAKKIVQKKSPAPPFSKAQKACSNQVVKNTQSLTILHPTKHFLSTPPKQKKENN